MGPAQCCGHPCILPHCGQIPQWPAAFPGTIPGKECCALWHSGWQKSSRRFPGPQSRREPECLLHRITVVLHFPWSRFPNQSSEFLQRSGWPRLHVLRLPPQRCRRREVWYICLPGRLSPDILDVSRHQSLYTSRSNLGTGNPGGGIYRPPQLNALFPWQEEPRREVPHPGSVKHGFLAHCRTRRFSPGWKSPEDVRYGTPECQARFPYSANL